MTTLGTIALKEQLWRCGPHTQRPFCTAAHVSARCSSRRLQRALTDFGADEAFAAAATKVQEHYGVSVPVSRVHAVTLHHAHVLAARIVAEADGTMVPVVDTAAAPPGTDRRKHRKVRYQEARLVAACAQGRYTVDLFHVGDYLAAAAPDPAHAKPFVAPLLAGLRASDHATVLATLQPRAEPPEYPDDQAPVRAALRYLENRPHQLDYAYALAHDLPVGSGLIESGHRHVIQARLKKAGAWWTSAHAHAMCQLRTLRANLQWDLYWTRN